MPFIKLITNVKEILIIIFKNYIIFWIKEFDRFIKKKWKNKRWALQKRRVQNPRKDILENETDGFR